MRELREVADFASAGDTWQPGDRYRVWLPELIPGRRY